MIHARDKDFRKARADFSSAQRAEVQYVSTLRKVAKAIEHIVKGFSPADPLYSSKLQMALHRYADVLGPWSRSVAARMIAEVAKRNEKEWRKVSNQMGRDLHREILAAPIGSRVHELLQSQVHLITSLPTEAAERVHRLTLKGLEEGTRPPAIAEEIMRTGEVTKSRATLIARTEVARTSTVLTQARAEHVGSTQYIWRTVGDSDVRPDHKRLNGKTFAWDNPPVADRRTGETAHPGCIYNCRCYAEPILPD